MLQKEQTQMMLLQKKKKQLDSVSGTGDITKNIDLKDTYKQNKNNTRIIKCKNISN